MTTGRLFEILYYLIEVKHTTAKELAKHFEVSVRTIYRDIDKLLMANIPIISKQGIDGGISIDKDFVLDKTLLSEEEQISILTGLESLSSLQLDEYKQVLKRMQVLFQKEKQDWIEVDFSLWHENNEMNQKFDLLKQTILHRCVITFDYINTQGKKSKKNVHPLKLFFKGNAWYLQAYDLSLKDYRTYKLSRITHLKKEKDSFLSTLHRSKPLITTYQQETQMIDVVFFVDKRFGSFVYDEFYEQDIIENKNQYMVSTRMPYQPWMISFFLSFGSSITVIKPKWLQQELKKEAKKIIEIYKT